MLKSPLVAGKCPRSLAGIDVSSGAVTSLVSGVAHSERLAVGDDDTGVMQEPVQDAGGGGVLAQKPAPLLEGPMGGYGQGAAFVGGGNKPEQQLGAGVIEWGEPDLVDDHQVGAEQGVDDLAGGVVGQAAVEGVDEIGGGEVTHLVTGMHRGVAEPDQDVALAGTGSEGDRLQQLRAVLPCEVRVVAETHPLFGRLLAAKSFKRWNGVLLLVIDLPDGSPGTIRCDATDVLGVVEAGLRSVLDAAGLRALRRLVDRLATGAVVGVSGVDAQVGSPRP